MARFGSSSGYGSDNLSATTDPQGNPIVSPDNSFAASPLGYAARAQSLYGIANPTFNLTPPEPLGTVSSANQIPYWDLYNDGDIIPTMYFDSTTETWDVDLNPSGAGSGATLTLKTRSYLLNDTNLSLRQKAYLAITKNGSFSGTAQWNLSLGAEYFTFAGVSLGSYAIGTVSHSASWTSISGTTTAGGTAIDPSAYYVDLSVTMTTLGTVTDTTTARVNSLLLATSQTATGSFLVTQRFNSSGTWTRPSGVNFVDVVAVGGGSGGQSGGVQVIRTSGVNSVGGNGGGAGGYIFVRNLYVGDQTSVSVGVGAGGAGGSASVSKGSGVTSGTAANANGASGGTSTFGVYVNASGGNGASWGAGGAASSAWLPQTVSSNGFFRQNGYSILPYQTSYPTAGATGGSGTTTGTGGSVAFGIGGTSEAGYACGTAGQGTDAGVGVNPSVNNGTAGTANSGAGGGGGAVAYRLPQVNGATYSATGGSGGNAAANSGSGGGGGGGVFVGGTIISQGFLTPSIVTASSKGGDGGSGYVIVAWTA